MLRLALVLVYNACCLLLLPWWAFRRARAAGSSGWLSLRVEASSLEFSARTRWNPWRKPEPTTLSKVRRAFDLARSDSRVKGVLVSVAGAPGGGASSESWRGVLTGFRESGRPLLTYLPDGGGTREYYLASAGNKIVLCPDARLGPLGLTLEAPYLKRALERTGVAFEVFARGEFKTAMEPMVQDAMSQAQRQQLEDLVDQSYARFLDGVGSGRRVAREQVLAWVERGPVGPRRALADGLVDGLAYEDELPLALTPPLEPSTPLVKLDAYARRRRMPFKPWRRPVYLAVVPVHGAITSEGVGVFPVADELTFSRRLERVRSDPRALGLLLHIDSRGGSALASARMLHEVERCARVKPVVAYFDDTAASGGYMIGVGAHEIVAQASTLTGSIGVVAARPVLQALLERWGVRVEQVKRGEHADMFSMARFMRPDTRAAFEAELDEVYRRFIEQVARGRGREPAAIEPLAGGRIWSGAAAHAHGLVDTLGDFEVALGRLRERIGTPRAARAEPRVVTVRARRAPRPPPGPLVSELVPRLLSRSGRELLALLMDPRTDSVLAWEPRSLHWGA